MTGLVGTDFQLGDYLRGEIGVGYQSFTANDDLLEDVNDVAFAGEVDWRLARSTTLSAQAERTVIDPGTIDTNMALETGGSLRLEHGLTPRVSLSGEAGFAQYAFENVDRDDERVDVKLGAHWKINQTLWLETGYELIDQSSDVQAFTDNRVLVRMRVFP